MSDVVVALRDRRRAQTVAEIKQAALAQLALAGAEGLSLRAVARAVGVSVQALYHYFESREALISALVADSFDALTETVTRAAEGRPSPTDRIVAAGLAYRAWAIDNRAAFLLTLGAPLADYQAPQDGPTTQAARRLGLAFRDVVFGGWTDEELGRLPLPEGVPALRRQLQGAGRSAPSFPPLPPGAYASFITGWSTLHGLVMLEVIGQLPMLGDSGAQMCRVAMLQVAERLDAHRALS